MISSCNFNLTTTQIVQIRGGIFKFIKTALHHWLNPFIITHALIKLFIAAMAYYINTLDSQSSGHGRCGPNYFKVGDLF